MSDENLRQMISFFEKSVESSTSTSNMHDTILTTCLFESDSYSERLEQLVNVFKVYYKDLVTFSGLKIQRQEYLGKLIGRFVTNAN